MSKKIRIGILLFNEVEVLDFAGPYEVFSIVTYLESNEKVFQVSTVGETGDMILARNGLKIQPHFSFSNAPEFDVLIVPGGYGAEEIEIHNDKMINWIQEREKHVEILASVCTGAFLLAEAGLLNGQKATTHWMDIDRLKREYPNIRVVESVKYVDEGHLITSGGISAGINMSFHIVEKLCDKDIARETSKRMAYEIEI